MRRIKELDCLRALAIGGVILSHYRPEHWDYLLLGWSGVDLFFVVSGFLITGILIQLRSHPTPFREFYWRRTLRIFPPYYVVLLAILVLATLHGEDIPGHQYLAACFFGSSVLRGLPADLMASRLFAHAGFGVSPVTINHHYFAVFQSGLWVFWSLSVEELFYLLWAPIVLKGSVRFIVFCSLAPLIVCPAIRGLALNSSNFAAVTQSFVSRFDTLAVGACLALLFLAVQREKLSGRTLQRGLVIAAPASALALALLSWRSGLFQHVDLRSTLPFCLFGYTLLAIFCASIVGLSVRFSGLKSTRRLRTPALVYVGSVSYMLYLIHIPVYVAVGIVLAHLGLGLQGPILQGVLSIAVAIGLAGLSWKYFEAPILKFKDRSFSDISRAKSLSLGEKQPHIEPAA